MLFSKLISFSKDEMDCETNQHNEASESIVKHNWLSSAWLSSACSLLWWNFMTLFGKQYIDINIRLNGGEMYFAKSSTKLESNKSCISSSSLSKTPHNWFGRLHPYPPHLSCSDSILMFEFIFVWISHIYLNFLGCELDPEVAHDDSQFLSVDEPVAVLRCF